MNGTTGAPERRIKWSYMDHWRSNGPAGPIDQWHSHRTMSAFLKQIKAVGFDAIDTFDFRLWQMYGDYGGPAKYQEMVQDHGLERIVNTFHAADYDLRNYAPHIPETHENILEDFRVTMGHWSVIDLDNIIVMPATLYYDMEPVTDDKLKITAELWNRVGEITASHGVRLTCHHEFFCGIQSEQDIETFYAHTDPAYVSLFVDTAQHCIASVDPVALYRRHAHRVSGFHFKDTRNVATGDDHRHRPDSEIMAPTTGKWFYEMGTPDGLVDFEAMMTAVRDNDYRGWISVEHDKANKEGGDYSESTAISRWYAANVLEKIYR
ncbi:TIM barrel protein [Actinoplanes sp. NPDC051633]|uniref:sugar phosphate isomerase/epimerase family protein n=1 Tax=Actinoplanes sp. NPDC051633 TaxID=3155670 RepID=UPI003427997B